MTHVALQAPHAAKQFEAAPALVQTALRRLRAELEADPLMGIFIPLRTVPRKTLQKWQARIGAIPNLHKLELPAGWRALYTVATEKDQCAVLLVEVVDHKEYDRLFGYRTS